MIFLFLSGFLSRRLYHGLPLLFWGLFWLTLGFFAATARSAWLDTPVVVKESWPLTLEGHVDQVRRTGKSSLRLVLSDVNLPDRLTSHPGTPLAVRISVRTFDSMPRAGDVISIPAVLMPAPTTSLPEGYDFARQLWFRGIGGVGYAVGKPVVLESKKSWMDFVEGYRQFLSQEIRAAYPGDGGGLAAALITGIRDGISEQTTENMRDAGLAHLLAISGLHMGLFTGAIFFFFRLLLSCLPRLALKYPIKKWAAGLAVSGGAVYLLLSGGSIPTVRAFIMVTIVFLGVMFDRKAISLRLVALAAIALLLFTPEVLLSISFQMSFAAVTGLVFFYEKYGAALTGWSNRGNGLIRKVAGYLLAILLTTLVAELTIGPIALFHFNRLVHFGLLANLVAMPVMALWVMPWIVVYLLLLPLQLEVYALTPMIWGIDVIISTADYVAGLPWSISLLPAMGTWSLILMVLGGLWYILWRSRLRLAGPVVFLAGVALAISYRPPDILIDNEGSLIAVRGEDGNLRVSAYRGSRIVREQWAQFYGQEKAEKWQPLSDDLGCDGLSCLYHPHTGNKNWTIAFVRDERALPEDCHTADLVVSLVPVKADCNGPKLILDRWDFYENGGHFIWLPRRSEEIITVENVRNLRGARPWTRPPR
ncbi:ComEC family competence protein [Emcibacter nanhaiensis]|uniref:ComEC family competence protein n=1 Tax=Emcibacter nanhaiensis TaxID=1505037 RepID=A0A501PQW1_9PROT|nr:ComEC family competence protein [Emcibacter nanhaiensis]